VIVLDFEQGSQEWLQARAGKVTASRVADIVAKGKPGAESASRRDYRAQLVAEILTGRPQEDGYSNEAMRWGTEQEPIARAAYEVSKGLFVDQVGLVIHPTINRAAASPDGLVGEDGLLEIKCPKTATHLQTLSDRRIPKQYEPQMLWQMACTGRQWCDFVSYDPRLPDHLQVFIGRLNRDEDRIKELEQQVTDFLAEVDAAIAKLNPAAS